MKFEERYQKILDSIKPTNDEKMYIRLKRLYCLFNRKYFENSLPSSHHVCIAIVPRRIINGALGESTGDTNSDFWKICICKESHEGEMELTLLHEMAHISVDRKNKRFCAHGPLWQEEMKRLANLGAFNKLW